METIISIDFDIIMNPSIELYNNFIDGQRDTFDELAQYIPLLNYANADLKLYEILTTLLYLWYNNNVKIIFIDTHEDVLKYIDKQSYIINIDHHHDLGYTPSQRQKDGVYCTNWAFQGMKQNKIDKYLWLHDFTSTKFSEEDLEDYIKNISEENIAAVNLMSLRQPDKVIVCSSYSWIPTNIRPLFELWKKLFKNQEEI